MTLQLSLTTLSLVFNKSFNNTRDAPKHLDLSSTLTKLKN